MEKLEFNMFITSLIVGILTKPKKQEMYDTCVEVDKMGYYLFKKQGVPYAEMGKVTLITGRYYAMETRDGHKFYDRKFFTALEYMGSLEKPKKVKKKR